MELAEFEEVAKNQKWVEVMKEEIKIIEKKYIFESLWKDFKAKRL